MKISKLRTSPTFFSSFPRFVIGRHHHSAWPAKGWSLSNLTKGRVCEFYKVCLDYWPVYILIVSYSFQLYIPSALAIASDFWRVTVIGVIAAKQGALEVLTNITYFLFSLKKHPIFQLAVFNVAYRFLWICLMFSGALARASGIKMAVSIGKASVAEAQFTARVKH